MAGTVELVAGDGEGDRQLTARSVLASALLGTDPPELPVRQLVRLAALFDIGENRARVALSRMVAAGEATTSGDGRYRLAGPLLGRQRRQRTSREGATTRWRGGWATLLLTAPAAGASDRSARRRVLERARFAELREGAWLRPDNLSAGTPVPGPLRGSAERLVGRSDTDPADLAARLWDLGAWAGRAEQLLDRLGDLEPADVGDLAPGFVLSASVLRHLQADPLLPPELLPEGWPGPRLRSTYDRWDASYRDLLAAWHRS